MAPPDLASALLNGTTSVTEDEHVRCFKSSPHWEECTDEGCDEAVRLLSSCHIRARTHPRMWCG